jgi:hypothetical protein
MHGKLTASGACLANLTLACVTQRETKVPTAPSGTSLKGTVNAMHPTSAVVVEDMSTWNLCPPLSTANTAPCLWEARQHHCHADQQSHAVQSARASNNSQQPPWMVNRPPWNGGWSTRMVRRATLERLGGQPGWRVANPTHITQSGRMASKGYRATAEQNTSKLQL